MDVQVHPQFLSVYMANRVFVVLVSLCKKVYIEKKLDSDILTP